MPVDPLEISVYKIYLLLYAPENPDKKVSNSLRQAPLLSSPGQKHETLSGK
jgi:hypothetical protein